MSQQEESTKRKLQLTITQLPIRIRFRKIPGKLQKVTWVAYLVKALSTTRKFKIGFCNNHDYPSIRIPCLKAEKCSKTTPSTTLELNQFENENGNTYPTGLVGHIKLG